MIKYILSLALLLICSFTKAQTDLESILKTAPNGAIVNYLTQNDWLDCIDYHAAGMLDNGATSSLGGKVVLTDISSAFAQLRIGDAMELQIGLINNTSELQDSAYVICMVKTFTVDSCKYSRVEIRDAKWQKMDTGKYLDIPEWTSLFCKPDTMTVEEFNEILLLPVSHLVCAELDKADNSINFMASNTSLNAEERKRVASISIKRNVKLKL